MFLDFLVGVGPIHERVSSFLDSHPCVAMAAIAAIWLGCSAVW